jgi:hypothetical protein
MLVWLHIYYFTEQAIFGTKGIQIIMDSLFFWNEMIALVCELQATLENLSYIIILMLNIMLCVTAVIKCW